MVLYSFDFKSWLVLFVDILLFLFFKKKNQQEKKWKRVIISFGCTTIRGKKMYTVVKEKKMCVTVSTLPAPLWRASAYYCDVSFIFCVCFFLCKTFESSLFFHQERKTKKTGSSIFILRDEVWTRDFFQATARVWATLRSCLWFMFLFFGF